MGGKVKEFVYGKGEAATVESVHVYRSRPFEPELAFWAKNRPVMRPGDVPVIWVDDQHGQPMWEMDQFLSRLEAMDLMPAGVFSEAAFVPLADRLVSEYIGAGSICPKTGIEMRREGVPTCTSLALAWTLARLGRVEMPREALLWGREMTVKPQARTVLRGYDVKAEDRVRKVFEVW